MAEQNTGVGGAEHGAAQPAAAKVVAGEAGGGVRCPRCKCPKCPVNGGTRRTGVYVQRYRQCLNAKCRHAFATRARLITTGPRTGQWSDEELVPTA